METDGRQSPSDETAAGDGAAAAAADLEAEVVARFRLIQELTRHQLGVGAAATAAVANEALAQRWECTVRSVESYMSKVARRSLSRRDTREFYGVVESDARARFRDQYPPDGDPRTLLDLVADLNAIGARGTTEDCDGTLNLPDGEPREVLVENEDEGGSAGGRGWSRRRVRWVSAAVAGCIAAVVVGLIWWSPFGGTVGGSARDSNGDATLAFTALGGGDPTVHVYAGPGEEDADRDPVAMFQDGDEVAAVCLTDGRLVESDVSVGEQARSSRTWVGIDRAGQPRSFASLVYAVLDVSTDSLPRCEV